MGWLLYLLRESPEIISIGAVCVGSWLLTLTAMLMVGRRKLVKFWAALFALVSLAGVLACGRILLGDSPEYEGARLPALIVGVGVVAMLIVCSEALCVKRLVPKSTRAKVLQA